jgi:probable HAF family extracellular repeat protein
MSFSHCLRFCCGLVVLSLILALAGDAKAQPTYSFTTIDVPGALYTYPTGINDSGQIVGFYRDASSTLHGFLLDNGSYTTLDVPGAYLTEAYGINDSGQIVGYYEDAAGGHGFLLVGVIGWAW